MLSLPNYEKIFYVTTLKKGSYPINNSVPSYPYFWGGCIKDF